MYELKKPVVVIGTGIGGLTFAKETSKHEYVTVLTKKEKKETNTNKAQGGISGVTSGNEKDIDSHIEDTLKAGCGLSDPRMVEFLAENSGEIIEDLMVIGVPFDKDLRKEGGHSQERVWHVGDFTGRAIEGALVSHVEENKNIEIMENYFVIDLFTEDGACHGVQVLDVKNKEIINIYSKVTVVATGGIGYVYKITSNPPIATGDGIAMAYKAGARIEDMEFVQFHPTTLNLENVPHFLITETARGEGAKLVDEEKKRFVDELLTRDVVSRAIFKQLKKGKKVYLDMRRINDVNNKFPLIYETCLSYGIDITKNLIPVSPAAHYICGGIKTNEYGETNMKGLFAFGECACTGVHGANRLASNSLAGSAVFSSLGATKVKKYLSRSVKVIPNHQGYKIYDGPIDPILSLEPYLRESMWDNVGIIRNEENLNYQLGFLNNFGRKLGDYYKHGVNVKLLELRNMATVGELITRAALKRTESRGTHYREDYPEQDDKNWLRHIGFLEGKLYKTPLI